MTTTPVGVEVVRSGMVESRHRVALAVAETGGRVVLEVGDVTTPVYPRSAVKPIQALALIESGAADGLAVTAEELALACASHGGEPMHIERVRAWLARIGLDESALACGAHPPLYKESARALRAGGEVPTPVHNNCSGKHTGMLTTAVHLEEPTEGYLDADHPVQQRIRRVFEELSGEPLAPPGIDGCGVPNWPMSLASLALAFANMIERGPAAERVFDAMRTHPELVAGTGRVDTALMRARGDVVSKGGAEGTHIALVPERGLALALKAEDGASRAADVALLAALDKLVGGVSEQPSLASFARPHLSNVAGRRVGFIEPAKDWLTS